MGLLGDIASGFGSLLKAPFSMLKGIGQLPGQVVGDVSGLVSSLGQQLPQVMSSLLPLAATMGPMALSLPPIPGLGKMFASPGAVNQAVPQVAQQMLGGSMVPAQTIAAAAQNPLAAFQKLL